MSIEELSGNEEKRKETIFHIKARQEKPAVYPERFVMWDEQVDWGVEYPEYKPTYFTADVVLKESQKPNGWAEPENLEFVKGKTYESYEGPVSFDAEGKPLNPRGRTGIEGRGLLGKWGPNFAADPIVTRLDLVDELLEMLAIQRTDNGEWAIPGGMVDAGEAVSQTLGREFKEEAGVDLDMSDAEMVYKGYVDDPRNTDNAWMETTAMHKHLAEDLARMINPVAGDDAKAVRWIKLNKENIAHLYASHGALIRKATQKFYDKNVNTLPEGVKKQLEEMLSA